MAVAVAMSVHLPSPLHYITRTVLIVSNFRVFYEGNALFPLSILLHPHHTEYKRFIVLFLESLCWMKTCHNRLEQSFAYKLLHFIVLLPFLFLFAIPKISEGKMCVCDGMLCTYTFTIEWLHLDLRLSFRDATFFR